MRAPSLRQIEAFKAFVETGTVSRAADVLHISQPAASKLLSNLETDSGLRLFDRAHGRMTTTARGMRLYEEIERLFSGVNQIAQAVEAIRKEERSRLAIGVMPGVSTRFIAASAEAFRAAHPDVFLSFTVRSSQFITEGLLSRQLDLGIVSKPLDHPLFTTALLEDEPVVCALPADHALADRAALTLADIAAEPMIAFAQDSSTRHKVERAFAAAGLAPNVVAEATTAQTVCSLVAAGIGLALVAPIFALEHVPKIAWVPIVPKIRMDIYTIKSASTRNASLADAFLCCLPRRAG